MSTLWLHIGHDKTGSSYLQRLLAVSRAHLHTNGFSYPVETHKAVLADMGHVSTGNGNMLLRAPGRISPPLGSHGALLSHEGFFTALAEDFTRTVMQLRQACMELGVSRIKVLLFVRNPIAHAGSLYQQEVRYKGLTQDPDHYFAQYQRPNIVWRVLRQLQACKDIHVRIENYSHIKTQLAAVLADWLGIDQSVFERHPNTIVNRGCTCRELHSLRRLNASLPRATPWAAHLLRLLRPHAPPDLVAAGYGAQRQVWNNNADAMALINRQYLAPEAQYKIVYRTPN